MMSWPAVSPQGNPRGPVSRRRIIAATFLALVVFSAGLIPFLTRENTELRLYLVAAERLRHGEPIYRANERAFTYPALFALPFVPFTTLPATAQRVAWYLMNVAALVVLGWRLHVRLKPMMAGSRRRIPAWLFWSLVVALAGRHLLSPLENQSHDLLLFLCVFLAIDASCAGRERWAGVMGGLGAALKATPLLFLPLLVWQRRFSAAVALIVGLTAFTFLPDLIYPAEDHAPWIVSWYETFIRHVKPGETPIARGAWGPGILNQSLAGTCHRLFTFPSGVPEGEPEICVLSLSAPAVKTVTLASQLAVTAWLCWITRPRRSRDGGSEERSRRRLGEGAALVVAMVLLSPTSIKTHFCVLLLPAAFCLADFLYQRRDWFVGVMLGVVFVLGTLTVRGVLNESQADRILAYGSVTACALALFAATGRVLCRPLASATNTGNLPLGVIVRSRTAA